MSNIKPDSLIRITKRKNENGDETTDLEWKPGSKEAIGHRSRLAESTTRFCTVPAK